MSATKSDFELIINKIAEVSEGIGFQSGEPASEMAGFIVSVLNQHPEWIPRFMKEGTELFLDVGFSPILGSLTYRAMNGKIMTPQDFLEATAVKKR